MKTHCSSTQKEKSTHLLRAKFTKEDLNRSSERHIRANVSLLDSAEGDAALLCMRIWARQSIMRNSITLRFKGDFMVVQVDLELWARDAGKAVDRGDLIIVIDVLRSGTSILNALTNGAEAVIPAGSLKEAYKLHNQHPEYLLVGERRGRMPKGFDLGNSPLEFTRERINGKRLVMTTTSGTEALARSRLASWVLVGVFLNAEAVARKAEEIAAKEGAGISLVLAGERGGFSLEDFLCAGAIVEELSAMNFNLSDKVQAALLAFRQAKSDLTGSVMEAEHAKHLVRLGFKGDVDFACQLNVLREVPIYRLGRITLQK